MATRSTKNGVACIRRSVFVSFLGLAIALLVAGCDKPPQDVSNDPSFGNFSAVVGRWRSKIPLRLVKSEGVLSLSCSGDYLTSPDLQELAALPVGTEINIQRLILRKTFEVDLIDVTGSVVSGPHAGKTVIVSPRLFSSPDMVGTSPEWHGQKRKDMTWSVAPDKLERVDTDGKERD